MTTVQVLMSTYNGDKYLREQIESLINQVGVNVKIYVRDDGSTDGTINILEEYEKLGVLTYYTGENLKPARSFMDLAYNAPDADYYAFCDQDDYWLPNKLIKAVEKIDDIKGAPALYFSKALLADENLKEIEHKGYPIKAYTFGEALIKNNATGCTMVFNKALCSIVKGYRPKFITMHDYWFYLICLAINGRVYYDTNSYIMYRQHGNNVVGGRRNVIKEYRNKFKMLINRDRTRSRIAVELKKGYYGFMCEENKNIINKITTYQESIYMKLMVLKDKKIKSSSVINNIYFSIAIIFNAF